VRPTDLERAEFSKIPHRILQRLRSDLFEEIGVCDPGP